MGKEFKFTFGRSQERVADCEACVESSSDIRPGENDIVISSFDLKLPNQILVKPRNIEVLKDGGFHCDSLRDEAFRAKLRDLGLGDIPAFQESNKYWDFSRPDLVRDLPEFKFWHTNLPLHDFSISGKIVKGFNRGSKQLGCPTANIEMTQVNKDLTRKLVPGVYSALGKFPTKSDASYMCAVSIGWNPTYEIPEMAVEAYIMHDFEGKSLYGEELALELKSFMRAETLFPSFDDLIIAIHCDVEAAKDYLCQFVKK